ncbi:hypothetical protein EUC41_14245 [Achromobacter denitrificans]|nr:hypothetical protein EC609_06130 [Achromobacter denitrificans]RSE89500.1 hypothetical protein EGU64_03090 [Achromobacter denitrificans]WFC67388.1 hypothetical protein EUC41_14245 [Achromobacter denitrificans]
MKSCPHAAPAARACCPPRGRFSSRGGPAMKKAPSGAFSPATRTRSLSLGPRNRAASRCGSGPAPRAWSPSGRP